MISPLPRRPEVGWPPRSTRPGRAAWWGATGPTVAMKERVIDKRRRGSALADARLRIAAPSGTGTAVVGGHPRGDLLLGRNKGSERCHRFRGRVPETHLRR